MILPAAEAPLDDEDLLCEILLRLAPQPSSLPRASLVCTRWRRILSDPQFLRRFRKHHRKPPLLGFFAGWDGKTPVFAPVLDSPDRIPAARFSAPLSRDSSDQWDFQGFRHGLAVLVNRSRLELAVWDPLTGQHHRVSFPMGIPANETIYSWYATVLCADADDGHVHGDCSSSPFKVVLMCIGYRQACAFVYDSACGAWGDVVSRATPYALVLSRDNILVGNVVYWLFCPGFLAFDLERQSLAVFEKPADFQATNPYFSRLLRTEDSELGLAYLARPMIKLWKRESNCDGVVGWVPVQKTIQLEELIPSTMCIDYTSIVIVGYDEDTNQFVLSTSIGNFMLQLDSMQIRHIIKRDKICFQLLYPYANFYITGIKS